MHSFYSFDYILRLKVSNITRLLVKAYEKREENKAWQAYLTKYAHMTEQDYIPFDEWFKIHPQHEEKTEEEILLEVKGILDTFKGGETNGDI